MNSDIISETDLPLHENSKTHGQADDQGQTQSLEMSESQSVSLEIEKDHCYDNKKTSGTLSKSQKKRRKSANKIITITKKNDLKNLHKNTQIQKKQFNDQIEKTNNSFSCKKCQQVFRTYAAAYFHSRKPACVQHEKKKKKFHKICPHPECSQEFSKIEEFKAGFFYNYI